MPLVDFPRTRPPSKGPSPTSEFRLPIVGSVNRIAGVGLVGAVVLMLLTPVAGATAGSLTFTAPYSGSRVVVFQNVSTCPTGGVAVSKVPASFNLTTGKLQLRYYTSAGLTPFTYHQYGNSECGGVNAHIHLLGPNFTWTKANGILALRTDWKYESVINLTTHVARNPAAQWAQAQVFLQIYVVLWDMTTGSSWTSSNGPALSSATCLGPGCTYPLVPSINSTLNVSTNRNFSLPIVVVMNQGDSYYYSIDLYTQVGVDAQHTGPNYSIAKYSIGLSGGSTRLTKVMIA